MADAAATALPGNRVNRRLAFVRWVRRTHGWFGLWGALLGLMAGTSGIWLNHRSVMKLELPDRQQTNTQLAIPGCSKRSRSIVQRPACGSSVRGLFRGLNAAAPRGLGRAGRRCSPSAGPSSSAGPTR
jgi:hypothetical protein